MRHLFACLIVFVIFSACDADEPQPVDGGDHDDQELPGGSDFNILFIGNSLTYYNDLPSLVKAEAEKEGRDVEVKMIAYANYAIVDHWQDGEVQEEIKSRLYDFVIIQQGPSSQSEGRRMLIDDGAKYAELCEEYDVKLAYYMVWPSQRYYHTFEGVIRNYTDAAEMNNALLCPVGEVWKSHFDETEDFSYYGPDGFHPSLEGSEVAAQVIYQSLIAE